MPLRRVTITGADDAVSPQALRELSNEFPFAEWGILFSESRAGTQRYPTRKWVDSLPTMSMAAHLCGQIARDILDGSGRWLSEIQAGRFQRVQLNGWSPEHVELTELARVWRGTEFVLQARSEDVLQAAAHQVAAIGPGSRTTGILFDPSGGTGKEPFKWPRPPHFDGVPTWMGYAGGIQPSNVLEVLQRIAEETDFSSFDYWIDMESGVRDEKNQFNLGLVRSVLSQAATLVDR